MDKKKEDFIETLQNNVAFQLSLTSKELFHSNFLAWLAEDKATRSIFNDLLQNCFGAKTLTFNPKKMIVKREYKNFDLCICEKIKNKKKSKDKKGEEAILGDVLFVLENKFKSLPYKEQLQDYQKKVEDSNKNDTQVYYCLLSLSHNFEEFKNSEDSKKWKVVTYETYEKTLRKINEESNKCPFYQELIFRYCDFIKTFSDYIKECLHEEIYDEKGIKPEAQWISLINHKEFYTIRCYDVWQKIVMQHCALFLAQKVKNTFGKNQEITMAHSDKEIWGKDGTENKGKLFTMVNFFHGEAFLELKYLIPGKGILAFQQQGNNPLRIGVLAMNANNGITPSLKKKDLQAWEDNVHKHIKKCGLSEHIVLKEEDVVNKKVFHSYGSFYYCDLKVEISPIEQTLKDMVDKMKELIPIVDSLSQLD